MASRQSAVIGSDGSPQRDLIRPVSSGLASPCHGIGLIFMCTFLLLRRPGHAWPVLIGANRDEMIDRPWLPPARHWPDRPEVVAGLDQLAGGSWLGLNDHGLVAAVLNRRGTLGPAAGRRSRGELVLEALDHADAAAAAEALSWLDVRAWRPFNLVLADNRDAFCLSHRGEGARVQLQPLPPGLTMVTAFDANDPADPRIRHFLPRFAAAALPEPEQGRWHEWQALLACREPESGAEASDAMCFALPSGFGTRSGSLLALPSDQQRAHKPQWLATAGTPDATSWQKVPL